MNKELKKLVKLARTIDKRIQVFDDRMIIDDIHTLYSDEIDTHEKLRSKFDELETHEWFNHNLMCRVLFKAEKYFIQNKV